MRRWAALAVGVVALAVAVGVWRGRSGPERPPNVLIVLWDTTRADHLSLYGYGEPTTPRLDAFAADATVYERATARGTWTVPTHASFFTGLAESSTDIRSASGLWLDDAETTLAESLGAAGYDTFAFSANLMVSPMNNLTQGFQTLHTSFSRTGAARGRYVAASRRLTAEKLLDWDASTEISPAFAGSRRELWKKAVFKDAAPVAHRALTDWLDERPDPGKPWFAYLNMMEAHSPRVPSLASRRAISDEDEIAVGLRTDASVFALEEAMIGKRTHTASELLALRAVYDAAVRDLDTATGALFDDLAARGILDDTVVVVMSDHGESLGEHDAWEHRWTVHEPLLHVPLVIRYPAKLAAERVAARVSTADVYATVLDLVGLDPNPRAASRSLVGRTEYDPFVFSQLLDPFASDLAPLAEAYPGIDVRPLTHAWCVAYEGETKYVHEMEGTRSGVYDLAADPGEDHPRTDPAEMDRFRAAILAWEETLAPYDPAQRTVRDERQHQQVIGSVAEAAMLAALGYVDAPSVDAPTFRYCFRKEPE